MAIDFDTALGIHPHALGLRAQRAEILAGNLANSDTPGYKARDIDFNEMLGRVRLETSQGAQTLIKTHAQHIGEPLTLTDFDLKYRIPDQPSIDNNTVDPQRENSAFSENAMQYLTSLRFISGRFKGMIGALKGE